MRRHLPGTRGYDRHKGLGGLFLEEPVDLAQALVDTGLATSLREGRCRRGGCLSGAGYDLAVGYFLLARVLNTAGAAEQALPRLDAARGRFEDVARVGSSRAAKLAISGCLVERGACLRELGRP